jgi:transposase InsO family protein
MDEDTCLALMSLRSLMPEATAAHLIREMEAQKLVSPGVSLNLSTVYRFLHRQGLMYPAKKLPQDRRKFEAELPNDLWQSDVMHGPMMNAGDKLRKSYLIAFIDDHSRLVPYGCFYLSERLDSYLDALKWALLKRGLPRKLYVDNGPAFRSKHLEYVAASLGIALIHSKPYTPQGRGKIERFFKTVRSDFLPGFKGKSLADINEAFETWLTDVYHQRVHGGTRQTPFMRFTANTQCIRSAPENLNDHFRKTARRRVAKDRTIVLNDRLYEGPVALIGKRVELLYHADMLDKVEVRYNQKSYGIARLVDIHVNCRVKRDKNRNAQITPATTPARYQGGKLLSRRPDNE